MGLFPDFFSLSCFTEHGHCMISKRALQQHTSYEIAVHYANEESIHDFFFKTNYNFILLIQKPLVTGSEET